MKCLAVGWLPESVCGHPVPQQLSVSEGSCGSVSVELVVTDTGWNTNVTNSDLGLC